MDSTFICLKTYIIIQDLYHLKIFQYINFSVSICIRNVTKSLHFSDHIVAGSDFDLLHAVYVHFIILTC
jgi:hypothetical protein